MLRMSHFAPSGLEALRFLFVFCFRLRAKNFLGLGASARIVSQNLKKKKKGLTNANHERQKRGWRRVGLIISRS